MRHFDKLNAVDDELHDLKLRFELLEGDRKAYYETSQWAIRQNKTEISQMRQKNKELSEAVAKFKKMENGYSGRLNMSELEKFDQRVCELHKKYDEIQAEVWQKKKKLMGMYDQLADLKRDSELVESNSQDSQEAKEIRMLENKLDKALIKYNEAQSIKKTYDQIVKKLQEERLTFDNQLANFEKTLKDRKQDAAELELMSKDANHAKEVAKAELARFEQQINEERKQREKDLQHRKELARQKMEFSEKLDRKALQLDGPALEQNQTNENEKNHYDEEKEKKIMEYEETIRLIKEVTGVSDIKEVQDKFKLQEETNKHLTLLEKQNEEKIALLKEKKKQVLIEFEELKFSSESKQGHSTRLVEEFKEHLTEASNKMNESKLKYERAARLLENAQSGIRHLYNKLESIHLPENVKPTDEEGSNLYLLEMCFLKLEAIVKNTEGKDLPEVPVPPPQTSQTQQGGVEVANILQVNQNLLPTFNTRVKLRPVEFEEEILDEDEENDDGEYGDVPDRDTIKRHTTQMLNQRQKSKQTKKTKKKRNIKDDD
ncbi:hypothetical protein HK099_006482 [Clydaea vesicula]|uniref:ODAD1 central coiled coil region domain-containing protein n=1 Tax=Clydaea vesicula TaxID=447962 RepID=A0AAD5TY85_9FUNG|nr:hypothetical protein HK099_006482 [Clydaea vesicula]KAJ3379966.1 hypothetical protein HDU92_006286 [Lobulomyces angularis]